MNIHFLVLGLIIANALVSIKGFNDKIFFDKYKFQIGAINRGEKFRMLTSAFLHVDYLHLILKRTAMSKSIIFSTSYHGNLRLIHSKFIS